jgi:hypothetical protein
MFWVSSSS